MKVSSGFPRTGLSLNTKGWHIWSWLNTYLHENCN